LLAHQLLVLRLADLLLLLVYRSTPLLLLMLLMLRLLMLRLLLLRRLLGTDG
jgi:hypothetical protein